MLFCGVAGDVVVVDDGIVCDVVCVVCRIINVG